MARDTFGRIVISVRPAPNQSDAKGKRGKDLPQADNASAALAAGASGAMAPGKWHAPPQTEVAEKPRSRAVQVATRLRDSMGL